MASNRDEFFEEDSWYFQEKLNFTLKLYKYEYIHRKGVDKLIKMFNEFITNSTLKSIKQKTEKLRK